LLTICLEDQRQAWEMLPDGRYRQRRPRIDDTSSPQALGSHSVLMRDARHASQMVEE
jgi:hypothetical protein